MSKNIKTSQSNVKSAPKKGLTITMMMMTVMIVTSIVSLRGLPSQAEFGFTSIFYYLFAAVVFLIPFSLVCAELASTFTKSGGLFRWVSEAFGARWGWAAMYLEWQTVVIWFPSVLMFSSVALAYIFWPDSFDTHLAGNKLYTIAILLVVYWLSTFNTFRGMKSANKLSTLGGLFGTIIPAGILIVLGIVYVAMGKPLELPMDQPFWPDLHKFGTLVLAASIFLFYGGMEMQAVHISGMKNPAKEFPRSVLLATLIIIVIFVLCTLAIGAVVPEKNINLLQSLLVAYNTLWASFGLGWLGHVMAFLITFGVIGQVSVIIAGPSTGILAVGKAGYLPKSLQKTNKNGVQVPILYAQAIFVTLLTFVLVILPSVQSAYQIMSQMATIIYLIMVIIIYIACIWLRHTQPEKPRGFKIPGGKFGIWLVTVIGVAGAILALVLSFMPPSQITTGSPITYIGILAIGVAVFFAIPFIVFSRRKNSWKDPESTFEPFDWQIENRKPGEISKWKGGVVPAGTSGVAGASGASGASRAGGVSGAAGASGASRASVAGGVSGAGASRASVIAGVSWASGDSEVSGVSGVSGAGASRASVAAAGAVGGSVVSGGAGATVAGGVSGVASASGISSAAAASNAGEGAKTVGVSSQSKHEIDSANQRSGVSGVNGVNGSANYGKSKINSFKGVDHSKESPGVSGSDKYKIPPYHYADDEIVMDTMCSNEEPIKDTDCHCEDENEWK